MPVAVFKCKHQHLELYVSRNRQQVQVDKEMCDVGPFGLVENQSCRSILNHL